MNYDCIFEQAAHKLGLRVDYSPENVSREAVHVLKIHGSCNFITEDIRSSRQYLTNPSSELGCRMDCLEPDDVEEVLRLKFSDSRACYYPVMSLYAFGKGHLVAGTRVQEIRNKWREYTANASVVAIIGVKPNNDDTHIWGPIAATSAKLFYIGSTNDFEHWASANNKFEFLAETFDSGFEGLSRVLTSPRFSD